MNLIVYELYLSSYNLNHQPAKDNNNKKNLLKIIPKAKGKEALPCILSGDLTNLHNFLIIEKDLRSY